MLIAFDFDGTLSDSEMTVLLGEEAGVSDEIKAITQQAMNDEIGYAESLRQRVDLLDGLQEPEMQEAFKRVKLRDGAADIIADLQEAGHHVAILTGGFENGVRQALDREGVDVDTIVANRLLFRDNVLTGEVDGPLIEGTKDEALDELAVAEGYSMSETIAIGDGANDLPMLQVAHWGIGYNPKPAVRPLCNSVVMNMGRLRLLFEEHGIIPKEPEEQE